MDDQTKTMLHKPGFVLKGVPHAEGIGLTLIEIGEGTALLKVAYAEHLVGDPETRVVHGGVVTSLLDNACGVSVASRTKLFGNIATLDLRIDYMKPATPDLDIFAFTECYRATKSIAFVRGVAFHTDKNDPIASCTAAFMLGTSDSRKAKTP
jgi:uncharacterized protein (TIGR00369 family)